MAKDIKDKTKGPDLRFPGFEGEWVEKRLGGVASKINSGKTPLGGEATYAIKGVLFIRSQNINNNRLELGSSVFISEEINNGMQNSIVKPNDILLNITGASLGRSCVVPEDFTIGNVNQHVCIIRLNEDYSPRFVQPILSSHKGQNIFLSLQTGSGREGLNFENIKNIHFYSPAIDEQQKIAAFLSLVDERIANSRETIGELKSFKGGMSKKIFSQELRFKDENGEEFPEWEVERLGNIASRITTKNNNHCRNVLTISAQFGLIRQLDFFEKSVSSKNLTGYYILSQNDFAYNRSYSSGYPIGAIKRLHYYSTGIVSTLYICFRFRNQIDLCFMEQYFEAGIHNSEIEKVAQEGARNHGLLNIGIIDFFNTSLILPSLPEQTRIANFLSSIDEKIEVEKKILELYKKQKAYLLQNMFV